MKANMYSVSEIEKRRKLKENSKSVPQREKVSAAEFEASLSNATIEISAVTETQKAILRMSYPDIVIAEGVTHTWLENGPLNRQRLHLIEFPKSKDIDAIVRLLDVIPREELMIPCFGQFS